MGKQSTVIKFVKSKMFMLLAITAVMVFGLYLLNPYSLKETSIRSILINMCVPGVMLASVPTLLIGGEIDLSVAAQAGLGALIFAQMLSSFPSMPWVVALIIALLVGVLFGLINVFLVNVLNFMSFIATIGMSSIYSGIALVWTRGNQIMIGSNASSFLSIGSTVYFKILPLLFIIMVAIVIIYAFVMSYTRFGRSVYMVGGNQQAARLSGLNPKKIKAMLFVNSSVISVLSGVAWASQKKFASSTNIISFAPNMQALSAGILGGVSFFGGSGGLGGAFAGLLLLNVFQNGINILQIPSHHNVTLQGLVLIVALIIDNINVTRERRALLKAAVAGGVKGKA